MSERSGDGGDHDLVSRTRSKHEILMFLFLTVILWPIVAVGFVGGWGLIVWIYQMLTIKPVA